MDSDPGEVHGRRGDLLPTAGCSTSWDYDTQRLNHVLGCAWMCLGYLAVLLNWIDIPVTSQSDIASK